MNRSNTARFLGGKVRFRGVNEPEPGQFANDRNPVAQRSLFWTAQSSGLESARLAQARSGHRAVIGHCALLAWAVTRDAVRRRAR